ncbi:MAG: hypothetical protein K2H98_01150 [Duncaniella sp.]|nr:hypothetical protein [Duncaniella sp.]
MKQKFTIPAILLLMASISLQGCFTGIGKGDRRDRNIEQAVYSYIDSIPDVEYVGMSDTRTFGNEFQAVIIYYAPDSTGIITEHNARITTPDDGSEIYSWENLDTQILSDVKQKVSDKLEEKGITSDSDDIIDAIIKLKKYFK